MIKEAINIIVNNYARASCGGSYWQLYILAVIYAYIYIKDKNVRTSILTYIIVNTIIIFNPIVILFLEEMLGQPSVYWRVFWTMPMGIAITYMLTQLVFVNKTKSKKAVVIIGIIFLIMISGKYIYQSEFFTKTDNYYKFPDNEVAVIEKISSLRKEGEFVKAFFQPAINAHVRQIDAFIIIGYSRSTSEKYNNPIIELTLQGKLSDAITLLRKSGYQYFVWEKDIPFDQYEGLELLYTNEQYKLYKVYTLEEVKNIRLEKGESIKDLT